MSGMKSFLSSCLLSFGRVFQWKTRRLIPEPCSDGPLSLVDLKPGDIAIDCGANVGNVTAEMARAGATVFAFEPNPYAFEKLRNRFSDNPNIHCINKGVLDRDGRMRLYLHQRASENQVHWSPGSSLLEFKGNVDPAAFVQVEVVDLAQFIANLASEIKVVKMDVEGVEYQIIHHLIDTGVIEKIEYLLVETHEEKNPELRLAAKKLKKRIAREGITNIDLGWV